MSKLLFIVKRDFQDDEFHQKDWQRLVTICDSLNPDNIQANPTYSFCRGGVWYGISNPVDLIIKTDSGILLGKCSGQSKAMFLPQSPPPIGNYALIRFDDATVECVTDLLASRTLWYYFDKELFLASTSQRAIISYLGNFDFEKKIIPWMLSTGTLGPDLSWDKRIKKMEPDERVLLKRNEWRLKVLKSRIEFSPSTQDETLAKENLKTALFQEFENTVYDFSKWSLPLSGGYDSRAILCYLKLSGKDISNLRTVTWGLEKSKHIKRNDAFIAKEVAKKLDVKNQYFETDLSNEPVEVLFNRFLICGEGRIDSIAAYMDGFEIWKIFFEQGIQGVIRGDEGFGWSKISSPFTARISTGLKLCSDIANLKMYEQWSLCKQDLPSELEQRPEESPEAWRDRLYHQFRAPVFLSALSDLKLPYLEQSNPFLSHQIIQTVRSLPDELRTSKNLFKAIVDEIGPEVPYASEGANAKPADILKKPDITAYLLRELSSPNATMIFSPEMLTRISKGLAVKKEKSILSSLKSKLIKHIPTSIKNKLKDEGFVPNIEPHILAFRVFLIIRMHTILSGERETHVADGSNSELLNK